MRNLILSLVLLGASPLGALGVSPAAQAQTAATTAEPGAAAALTEPLALLPHLQMDALFALLVEEGGKHGRDLEAAMFPDRGGARWQARVAALYADPALRQRFDAAFAAALQNQPDLIADIAAFIETPAYQRIADLEIAARRVMLDEAATEAAEVTAEKLQAERAPRLRLIRRLIEAGDLVEPNVAGTMTGLMAFDAGLAATAPAGQVLPEADRRAALWNEEGQIRAETTNWMVAFMVLAYAPLSDDEMKVYADFYASDAGQAMNAALFAGFDAAITPLMGELGRAAGRVVQGRDI